MAKPDKEPSSAPIVLLTTAEGRDETIPALINKATNIPLKELVWEMSGDPEAFDAELTGGLTKTNVVVVDLGALSEPGIALCTRLQQWREENKSRLKLLALGGEDVEEHQDAAYLAGCDVFLPRPLDRVEFLESLRKLETWQLRGAHRAPVEAHVIWTHADGARRHGEVVDLSETGVLFRSEQPIPAGQNVALEVELPNGPPVLAWIRVLRTMPLDEPMAAFTAKVAAEFLNMSESGREAICDAIAAVRRKEFLARLETEYAARPIVLNDHQTELIADWLHFLFTPVAFGNPPAPCGISERILKQWALRLPPSEEQLFRDVALEAEDVSSSSQWVRAWVGFRVRLFSAAMQGQLIDDLESVDAFLKEARALLSILSDSLTAWDLFEKDMPDADLNHERATVLLTLREGLALRELYEENKNEDDAVFMDAIERAEDFFADRDFDAEQATYQRGAFREQVRKRRRGKDKKKEKSEPRVRPGLLVTGGLIVILGGGLSLNSLCSVENRVVEDESMLTAFPEFASTGFSSGKGTKIFIGEVDIGQWSIMSVSERKEIARRLKGYLEIGGVRTALVSNGKSTAIQIEKGRILVVR